MNSNRKTQIVAGLCSLAILTGCAAPQEEKKAPSTALECRKEIYDDPTQRSAVIASGGGLSLGASVVIALASGAMSSSVASGTDKRRLNTCYDSVQAPASERWPLTTATKQRDEVLLAGGSAAEADQAVTAPARRGPGGGAGFGSL